MNVGNLLSPFYIFGLEQNLFVSHHKSRLSKQTFVISAFSGHAYVYICSVCPQLQCRERKSLVDSALGNLLKSTKENKHLFTAIQKHHFV